MQLQSLAPSGVGNSPLWPNASVIGSTDPLPLAHPLGVLTPIAEVVLDYSSTRCYRFRLPTVGVAQTPSPNGILGPLAKRVKKTPFLGACGAKLRGSGGAPPTNLILLRNQRTRRIERPPPTTRSRHRLRGAPTAVRRGPEPHPTEYLPQWSGGWRVGLTQWIEECVQRGKDLPPSTQATTAALRFAPTTVG